MHAFTGLLSCSGLTAASRLVSDVGLNTVHLQSKELEMSAPPTIKLSYVWVRPGSAAMPQLLYNKPLSLNDRAQASLAAPWKCGTTRKVRTGLFKQHGEKAAGQLVAAEVATTLTREARQSGRQSAEPCTMGQHGSMVVSLGTYATVSTAFLGVQLPC